MRRIPHVIVTAVLLLALSACSSHPPGTPKAYGTVSGMLVREGGTFPGTATTPIPGTIELSAHGHRIVTIHVPVDGTFREQVPTGSYEVAATSPSVQQQNSSSGSTYSCPLAHPIAVTTGQTTNIQLACIVP